MQDDADILRFLWAAERAEAGTVVGLSTGSLARIVSPGERGQGGEFQGAVIDIGGLAARGDVLFGKRTQSDVTRYTILHVVSSPQESLLTHDGERIPQMVTGVPEDISRKVASLRNDPMRMSCASYVEGLPGAKRTKLFESLSLERLGRKCREIGDILDQNGGDWHQTLHVMLFRAMGGNRNREPYMKLASRASYHMVLRERSSPSVVEALLLGTSGLLEGCYYDDYIHSLRGHYDYLCSKYRLDPMRPDEWENFRGRPAGGVVIRIVQLASFLSDNDFLFDRVVNCRSREEIHTLFKAEASDYWTTHYRPDEHGKTVPKRIGMTKSDLLGINLVIPMIFAYGNHTGKEHFKEAAVALYEDIPPESNTVLKPWTGAGVPLANAQDSQALLQMSNEYCAREKCTECPVGKSIIKMAL